MARRSKTGWRTAAPGYLTERLFSKQLSCPLWGTHNDEKSCRVSLLRLPLKGGVMRGVREFPPGIDHCGLAPLPCRLPRFGVRGRGFSARFRPAPSPRNAPKVRRAEAPAATTGAIRGKAAPAASERRPSFSAFFLGEQEKGQEQKNSCTQVSTERLFSKQQLLNGQQLPRRFVIRFPLITQPDCGMSSTKQPNRPCINTTCAPRVPVPETRSRLPPSLPSRPGCSRSAYR